MNERIEKLMDQSLNVNWYGFLDKDCVGQFTRSDLKKFAELIIQECAAHLHRRGVEGFGILEERNLKEHFGVDS